MLDVTGSMSQEISGVRDNIVEFTDSLSYQGIDFRLAMVTFLDEIENIYDFTSNVQLFQQYVNDQYALGGAIFLKIRSKHFWRGGHNLSSGQLQIV